MTDPTENTPHDAPNDERKTGLPGLDERTGQVVIDAARTGLYAAAGLADAMAGAVKVSYRSYQEDARERRAKRAAQAEDVKNFIADAPAKAQNLPEQAREWPDQMRVRAEEFIAEARSALSDLAARGREAVERVRTEGLAGVAPDTEPVRVDAADLTEEGFGVNADTDAPSADVETARAEAPGEGFGVTPEAVETAGISDDGAPTKGDSGDSQQDAGSEADPGTETSDAPGVGFDAPAPQGDGVTDTPPSEDRPI